MMMVDPFRKTLYASAVPKRKSDEDPASAGRPLRGAGKTSLIAIRVTADERAEYEAAAKAKDPSMSVSEWIRDCCKRILARARR